MQRPNITINKTTSFSDDRPSTFDNNQRALLLQQGYTAGMIRQLELANSNTTLHIWILDNSGSTNQVDGYRMIHIKSLQDVRTVKCTRWEEIMDTALYHAQLATLIKAPTIFRLLNTCPNITSEFRIVSDPSISDESLKEEVERFQQWLVSVQPMGRTPLTHHIYEIRQLIQSMKQAKCMDNQRFVLTIATDGLPSDEKGRCSEEQCALFLKSLRMLEKSPMDIIIRLIGTDDSDKRNVSVNES